ncbi:c-type cytochrome [Maritalea mediterranea]|uniref:Cytochrome c n=1 Tax=Maritalea mediterranea TaxID=2909667 RepID=A0ABS9EDT3_9HYPH|nr:cytochrome c [Maritalea mediterranea]MCF4099558.1 cytochrome c [Maritalea mediterranea]
MRRIFIILLALVIVLGGAAAIYFLRPIEGPVRDLSLTADVERGQYVMRLGGCVACHTDLKNDGALLAGGPPLKTPFGDFIAPNITSHPDAGIGDWSVEEFARAMSVGEGPGGKHYYPAFPYDNYTVMSDQDIVDLYAALMASSPVAEKAPDHNLGFPFNIRLAMLGWKNLFFEPRRFEPNPEKSALWNRGAYLAQGPAHCGACHTPRNILGASDTSQYFMGARGGTGGSFVPPITPESLKADGWDEATLTDALTGGFTPDFDTLGGSMGEVINESLVHWTEQDIQALVTYLLEGE